MKKNIGFFSDISRLGGRNKFIGIRFNGKVVLPVLAFLFGVWFREVAARPRICLINECRYSANLNKILPSLQSGHMQTLGMYGSYRAIFSYISMEEYIFFRGDCHKRKTGLQNAQCAQAVVDELRVYLDSCGYDIVYPTRKKLKELADSCGEKPESGLASEKYFNKVCDFYGADMLIFLTDHRMDLTLDSRRVTRKPKVVSGKLGITCCNVWSVYVRDRNMFREVRTEGRDVREYPRITREQRDIMYLKRVWGAERGRGNDYYRGKPSVLSVVSTAGREAAEGFEKNW